MQQFSKLQVIIWKTIYLNFRERYEDMIENRIDFVSYICNISICESLKKNYSWMGYLCSALPTEPTELSRQLGAGQFQRNEKYMFFCEI